MRLTCRGGDKIERAREAYLAFLRGMITETEFRKLQSGGVKAFTAHAREVNAKRRQAAVRRVGEGKPRGGTPTQGGSWVTIRGRPVLIKE